MESSGLRVYVLVDDESNITFGYVGDSDNGYKNCIDLGEAEGDFFFIDGDRNPRFKDVHDNPLYRLEGKEIIKRDSSEFTLKSDSEMEEVGEDDDSEFDNSIDEPGDEDLPDSEDIE